MSKIVLIRPGRTDYDDQSRLVGTLDLPMNPEGQDQVSRIVAKLKLDEICPGIIYTGPMQPANSAAREIADQLGGVKVKQMDELQNVNQGLWQGLREEDVRKRYPQFFRAGREMPQTICPPEGETLCDAAERMKKVLNKGIRKFDVLAIVVSDPIASVIRCILEDRGMAVACCLSGEDRANEIEYFETDRFDLEKFVNWETCQDGARMVTPQTAEATGT